jgi:hypothetical protein
MNDLFNIDNFIYLENVICSDEEINKLIIQFEEDDFNMRDSIIY